MSEGEQSELLFLLQMRSVELLSLSVLSGSDLTSAKSSTFRAPQNRMCIRAQTDARLNNHAGKHPYPWMLQPRTPKV